MIPSEAVRPCQVCGTFYPAKKTDLTVMMELLLDKGKKSGRSGSLRGLVLPHAGYIYSGPTAACGVKLLQKGEWTTVVVVSPSHREYFDGVSVYPGGAYGTPLGKIPINSALRTRLLEETTLITASSQGHGAEHAIEVQLPLLQHALGDFSLLPIVIGNQTPTYCFELGRALSAVCKGCLLVASTDLSHYHPATTAEKLDSIAVEDVRQFDFEKLMNDLEDGSTEACGGGPTVAVMTALHQMGAKRFEILDYSHSGNVTGDLDSVVGYLAAAAFA
jgi:hypothetical protein